jgi:hypothetical protein
MSGPEMGEYELGGGRNAAGSAVGWPFLIARGRRRGYTILLAPDFLVAEREYGFLEEVAGTSHQDSPVRTVRTATPGGQPVCLVWTEYSVRAADLADGAGVDPVDEHSRPLRLVHGFLCADGSVTEVSTADLDHAHRAALDTYRWFLDDEDGFSVRPSSAFRLASVLATPNRLPSRVPAGRLSPEGAKRRVDTRRWTPIATAVAVIGVALVAAALVFGIQLLGSPGAPAPTVCTSTTTTAAAPTVTTLSKAGVLPKLTSDSSGTGTSPAPNCPN